MTFCLRKLDSRIVYEKQKKRNNEKEHRERLNNSNVICDGAIFTIKNKEESLFLQKNK